MTTLTTETLHLVECNLAHNKYEKISSVIPIELVNLDHTLLTASKFLRSPKWLDIGGRCRGSQQMSVEVYNGD